ncbi:MBL fold metallo-hydrolase [Streptomyces sp. NBC_00470]|uniref:MBL fold metallo-hydrolase n=1 Tax=Streptomyces sp. NBC_00470 TaxID=2975753 RepID=UPI002F91917B
MTHPSSPSALDDLGGGLYLWHPRAEPGSWGNANCLLVSSGDEAALVDTPYDIPRTQALLKACTEVLPSGVSISNVINTHANGDHSFGNFLLPDARVISTRSSAEHLCSGLEPSPETMHSLLTELSEEDPLGWYARTRFGGYDFEGIEVRTPDLQFTDDLGLRVGELNVQLIEVGPAHSPGDLVAYVPERGVVAAGDVLFAGDHPVHWAGSISNIIEAIKAVLALDPAVVIPGHGPVMRPDEVHGQLDYLRDLSSRIRHEHARGLSARQAAYALLDDEFRFDLGAPERLVILTAVEYAHLDGTSVPDAVQLARRAAHWAFHNRSPVPR